MEGVTDMCNHVWEFFLATVALNNPKGSCGPVAVSVNGHSCAVVLLWVIISTAAVLLPPSVEGKAAEVKRMAHDEFHVHK